MTTRQVLATLAVLLTVPSGLASPAAFAADAGRDDPKSGWRNGPVRTIMTPEEDKTYKALSTDEERAKAIAGFWARRDPTPGTPENEYKIDFYKRVDDATTAFRGATGAGWATDRGKVLLMLGAPQERSTPSDNTEIWTYSLSFLEKAKAAPASPSIRKIKFTKDESGEFRMDSEGEKILDAVRGLDPIELVRLSLPRAVVAARSGQATAKTAAPTAGEAGTAAGPSGGAVAPPPVPPEIERLRQAVVGEEAKSEIGLATSVRCFMAEDRSTDAVFVISVRKTDITAGPDGKHAPLLYARLLPSQPPGAKPVELLDQDLFTLYDDTAEGWLEYAFSISLKPGAYELRAGASDGTSGKTATRVDSITLPDFSGGALALSSVTLALSADPAAQDLSKDDPYRCGTLRLIPRVSNVLGPQDVLSFFYEVYNSGKDPGSGQPSLDVSYMIEKKEGAGWAKKLRNPILSPDRHEESLGYTIESTALSKWPAGAYRVAISVKDKVTNTEALSSVEFSIRK